MLSVWLGHGGEGASFWLGVLTELRNRGVDVLIACCDGLTGLPDALEGACPQGRMPWASMVRSAPVATSKIRTGPFSS